jgi:7-cyano-7-deazaguanine synthase
MISPSKTPIVGLLVSGGLDSAILLGELLRQGREVQPFYVRAGHFWEADELATLRRLLERLASPRLRPLVVFDMPLADVYRDHWSMTGQAVPDGTTPDEAVYLPGRNALLVIKAALWCGLNGIDELALAPLGSNPFADATPRFFQSFEDVLNLATSHNVRITRPFAELHKADVMKLGRDLPLELTFSCIAPVAGLHCGTCNKCAERREAFRSTDMVDRTQYAAVDTSTGKR